MVPVNPTDVYKRQGQTNIPGSVDLTGMSGMKRLMAAVAGAKADMGSFVYDMAGSLIIQNVVGLPVRQHRFLDINPAQFGFRGPEKVFDEIFLHIHVLIVEFAEIFLIDIPSGPHQGKFEESGHRRRHHKLPDALIL